jgi:acyl-CoA thioester hydrolase
MGRTELLRVNGLAYKNLEETGIFFVVSDLSAKYRRPALYDEALNLTTTCSRVTNARVEHIYILKHAQSGIILAEGTSTLACVDKDGKVRRVPEFMFSEE